MVSSCIARCVPLTSVGCASRSSCLRLDVSGSNVQPLVSAGGQAIHSRATVATSLHPDSVPGFRVCIAREEDAREEAEMNEKITVSLYRGAVVGR